MFALLFLHSLIRNVYIFSDGKLAGACLAVSGHLFHSSPPS